jgi:hypothetical protein
MSEVLRCLITNNPVGTDTWMVGRPCQCQNCREMLKTAQQGVGIRTTLVGIDDLVTQGRDAPDGD